MRSTKMTPQTSDPAFWLSVDDGLVIPVDTSASSGDPAVSVRPGPVSQVSNLVDFLAARH